MFFISDNFYWSILNFTSFSLSFLFYWFAHQVSLISDTIFQFFFSVLSSHLDLLKILSVCWNDLLFNIFPILCLLSNLGLFVDITASLIAQLVENPPAMQETPVQFLGWEDPLEKEKATHSSTPWGGRVRHNWTTFTFTFILDILTIMSRRLWILL